MLAQGLSQPCIQDSTVGSFPKVEVTTHVHLVLKSKLHYHQMDKSPYH